MKSLVILLIFLTALPLAAQDKVKNVILFVGDGMGYGQVKATGLYFNSREGSLSFESLPVRGEITTHSASSDVTDSAAAATALATGQKTINGYVGRDSKARDLPNIFQLAKYSGKSTGIVTTVSMSHATPAGFAAHEDFREKKNGIVDSLISDSRPNILFGAATEINPEWARFKGYQVVTTHSALANYNKASNPLFLSGQFGKDELPWEYDSFGDMPRLREMTRHALRLLADNPQGFLLMIEGGKIDWASHHADLYKTVHEVKGMADAVSEVLSWMEGRDDTLLLVTADHETGGLDVRNGRGQGQLPDHSWTMPRGSDGTLTHSGRRVPVYAKGQGEGEFAGSYDNTDIFKKLVRLQGFEPLHRILSQGL
jgi:alkaline phosphatase